MELVKTFIAEERNGDHYSISFVDQFYKKNSIYKADVSNECRLSGKPDKITVCVLRECQHPAKHEGIKAR